MAHADAALALWARGGPVVPWIFALSCVMWALIVARFRHLRRMDMMFAPAQSSARSTRVLRRLREQRRANLAFAARRHLPLIRALVQVLPLLGLLGTVVGLVHTFEGIALLGENQRRAIADGIAEAMFATLGGLFTALSGLLACTRLEARVTALLGRIR